MLAILMPWRHHLWPPGCHLPSICSLPTSRLFNLHSLRKSIVIEVFVTHPGVFISFIKSDYVILHFECIYVLQFAFGEGEFCVLFRYFVSVFWCCRTDAAQRLLRFILLPRSPRASSAEPPLVFTQMATFALHCEPSILPRIVSPAESCLGGLDELLISLIFPADSKCSV